VDPFNSIYLETSTLVRIGWPRVIRNLRQLLDISRTLHRKVFLPIPVELEHEEHWLRKWDTLCQEAKTAARPLTHHLIELSTESCVPNIPDRERVLADYKRNVQTFKTTWNVEPVPFTGKSTEELFRRAIAHQLPFKEEGAGFQDAVIYFSVIDHLLEDRSRIGALIANDDVFNRPEVAELGRSVGAQVVVHRRIEETFEALLDRVAAALRNMWHRQQRAAAKKINEQIDDLRKHLVENLDVSEVRIGLFRQPVGIARIEVSHVEDQDVRPPWPPLATTGSEVGLTFSVNVTLVAIEERYPEPPPLGPMKVGEERATGLAAALLSFPAPPERVEVAIPGIVDGEAVSKLLALDRFDTIRLGSVSLRR
jgi:hypothetical protein